MQTLLQKSRQSVTGLHADLSVGATGERDAFPAMDGEEHRQKGVSTTAQRA
jgi:hypothetical protein